MNNPLISVIIPFYNNQNTLELSIKSVIVQTYVNWELILLNDGSTDNSLSIAQKFNDKRIRIVSDGINRGLVYRLNQSPLLAKGEFISRLDGDDMMHPEKLEKQMIMFRQNALLDLVDTGSYSIDENGKPLGIRGLNDIIYSPLYILKNAMLLHASILGKKEWFLKNKYNPNFVRAEDRELWLRTYSFSNFDRVKEPLYIVREGSVNLNNYIKSLKTVKLIYKIYGPNIISSYRLLFEIFLSNLKILIVKILGNWNLHYLITKRRNKSLSIDQMNDLNLVLSKISRSR